MESPTSAFHPGQYSDIPLYNIQAVAAATGVPSITLRSWERRYSVPVPKRDTKGYRLYSERDIAIARWLKERVQQGVGISRAVNMLRVLERGELAPETVATFDFDLLRARLLDAIARVDEGMVNQVISEALMVAPVEDVSLRLLQPALYEVGTRWAAGHISVTSEHVGSNLIRAHLAALVRVTPPPLRTERILVGCAPNEQHDIGALMLALFLRRRGFDVIYVGANIDAESFPSDLEKFRTVAVCLSVGSVVGVRPLYDLYTVLKNTYSGVLAFGGRAFNEDPALADEIPGIWLGSDAGAAVARLESTLAS